MTERFVSPCQPPNERQREILTILIEEAAEVQQRATKALRFGLDEVQPGQPDSNATRLAHECGDFLETLHLAMDEGLISPADADEGSRRKHEKLKVYMQTAPI